MRELLRGLVCWLALAGTAGCAAVDDRADYHRHALSDLREDRLRPGVLLFEATATSMYPADDPAAEAVRMQWLEGWMKRSRGCPAEWEILSRSEVDPREVHARRHNLRYEIQCAPAAR
jgi:hypothetical protein